MKSTSDIRAIIKDGANIKLPASKSTSDLRAIAREAKQANTHVTIFNAGKKSTSDLRAIAKENPGGVTLEFD